MTNNWWLFEVPMKMTRNMTMMMTIMMNNEFENMFLGTSWLRTDIYVCFPRMQLCWFKQIDNMFLGISWLRTKICVETRYRHEGHQEDWAVFLPSILIPNNDVCWYAKTDHSRLPTPVFNNGRRNNKCYFRSSQEQQNVTKFVNIYWLSRPSRKILNFIVHDKHF